MLSKLLIKNMAVIKELEIDLSSGLNIITGETGAGKSMIIDALTLLCGGRASTDAVRTGEEWCEVQGVFSFANIHPNIKKSFLDNDIPCEDEIVVRRLVQREGKSRAYINGVIVNLGYLESTVGSLVSILSQHEHQKLFDPSFQLELLDSFLGNTAKVVELNRAYRGWKELDQKYEDLKKLQTEAVKRADYLKYQIGEIKEHSFKQGEEEELIERVSRADHSVMVLKAIYSLTDSASQGESSASEKLSRLVPELSKCSVVEPEIEKILELINDAVVKIDELCETASKISKRYDFDEAQIEEDRTRLSELKRLKKKFVCSTLEEILQNLNNMEQELANLESVDSKLNSIELDIKTAKEEYLRKAKELSSLRKKGSSKLSKMIENILDGLGMFKGGFKVEFKDADAGPNGTDRIEYLISTNTGEIAKPISKIASGGELSRLMLAVQSATNEVYGYGVQIFDEVDAGIGGDIGFRVGGLLKGISSNHQVLVITHLPQIAVFASSHLKVWKEEQSGRTVVRVDVLGKEARFNEVTRMLGMENHKIAVSNAMEMLAKAQKIQSDRTML